MSSATLRETAEAARKRAEDAQRAAAEAQRIADEAAEQARRDAENRLRRDARRVVDTFDRQEADTRTAISEARKAFEQAAVTASEFSAIRDAYLTWHARAADIYVLYRALGNALGTLGISSWKGRAVPSMSERLRPAPFAEALSKAIDQAAHVQSADIEDAYHARINALQSGEGADHGA